MSTLSSERDPITHRFIGRAMKVHTLIGPGLGEEIYHRELVIQLIADGVEFFSKPRRELVYRGIVADVFEPDLDWGLLFHFGKSTADFRIVGHPKRCPRPSA